MAADGTASANRLTPEQAINFVPQADSLSIETVINMLVQKGICTTEELFMLEGKIRDKNDQENQTQYVRIKEQQEEHSGSNDMRWLKRKFSKYRWTRRLGTFLFGWRWRKIKRAQHDFPHDLNE
jgi:hypothetical protein